MVMSSRIQVAARLRPPTISEFAEEDSVTLEPGRPTKVVITPEGRNSQYTFRWA